MAGRQDRLTGHNPVDLRNRLRFFLWVISIALSILMVRMWYLQVIRGDVFRQRSENNRICLREVKPLRGRIYDIRGNILVDNQASFDVSIIPEDAEDVDSVVGRIKGLYAQKLLEFSGGDVVRGKVRRPFVPIKLERNISREKLSIVETNSLDLPGVVVDVMPVRKYIFGDIMAHILGYVGEISSDKLESDTSGGYKSGDMVGKQGIEKYLDRYIKGQRGGEQVEVNVAGRELRVMEKVDPVPGCNVVLTIDSYLQNIAWDALEGKAGSVIVINPRDGSVMAMVNRPAFNPNLFNRGISQNNWRKLLNNPLHPMRNRAISGQYIPASTYKLIVAAAALEEGLITPEASFFCDGSYKLGNRTFRCWKKGGHGEISLHRAIAESCDVYFYNIGKMVGVAKLAKYSLGFGLGAKTGINLPGEKSGLVPTKRWKLNRFKEPWQLGETTCLAIGQGFILATPLQLLNAYCALANGGTLYVPRIVKRLETADGRILEEFNSEIISHIPVSEKNIEILKRALWGAVNEVNGTGRALKRKEEDVCGKTGTAQVVGLPQGDNVRKEKIPYKLRDHALFVCFAPYKNSEIAVAVVVEHGGHGGSAAAPIARKIIDSYFNNIKMRSEK